MKSFLGLVVGMLLAALALLPTPAYGQHFIGGSMISIGADMESGQVFSWRYGANAVATTVQINSSYYLDPTDRLANFYTNFRISGVWMDPDSESRYLDELERRSLQSVNEFRLTNIRLVNGDEYRFDELVSLDFNTQAGIWRDDERTSLTGYFFSTVTGNGAIPVLSNVTVEIFEGDYPPSFPRWEINISTEWDIVTPFRLVPAPGATALLGLGGLVAFRRRR